MTADGGDVTQLTRGGGFHGTPGWSPSGTSIAITSDWGERSLNGIWIIPAFDADGVTVDEARRITYTRDQGAESTTSPSSRRTGR